VPSTPVIAHVQQAVRLARDDTAEEKLMKLERALQPLSFPLHEVVPLMAALLAVPLPDGRYPPLQMTPLQQRQQTYDALVAWMLEEAERQPVLMVWEDLHWADPSTLELLGLFIDQAPTAPLLHLLTFRPEFVPPWPTRSHMTPLTLHRLERPQVEAMIARLANGKTLPVEVAEHIVSKTDGVPQGGLAALEEALTLVEKTGERYYEAELHRQRGELLLLSEAKSQPAQGSREQHEAEACFQHALDVARQQQAKSLELRAAMSLARLWQRQGKCAETYDLLAPVYNWFTEGFDTADLMDAKALLDEL
jgi:hypothetical protein